MGDLTDLFDKIIASIQGLGTDQLVALMFGIMAFGVAKKVVREGISLVMSVVGILFCLYLRLQKSLRHTAAEPEYRR